MTKYGLLTSPMIALLSIVVVLPSAHPQDPTDTPASRENIEFALKLTRAAAAEYEFRVGEEGPPLVLQREPVLRWSNPDRGEVHGNVFLWTRNGRPLVVGSLFKWFRPFTHMSHEFQSLAEAPLNASFHGKPVWKTTQFGLRFIDIPGAAIPAAGEAQRFLQVKQLAKEFSGAKTEREETTSLELRLLPQPIYRYADPKQGVLTGALFAFVHGTDPELFLLIEAHGEGMSRPCWKYAATRMNSVAVRLNHRGREVWSADVLPSKEVYGHENTYTSFLFKQIPEFLTDALPKPGP